MPRRCVFWRWRSSHDRGYQAGKSILTHRSSPAPPSVVCVDAVLTVVRRRLLMYLADIEVYALCMNALLWLAPAGYFFFRYGEPVSGPC